MKKRTLRVQAAGAVQAILLVFLITQCGSPKREFQRGGAGAGGGVASAGKGGNAGSGTTGTAGRSGAPGDGGAAGEGGDGGDGSPTDGGSGGLSNGGSGGAGAPVGTACSVNGDCALGNCIDGVCCESACAGCKACSGKLTGKNDGTCAPVVAGQDPHDQCDDVTSTNQCGTDGTCDGAGACRKVSSSHVCGAAACTGSTFKPVATCDGAGACSNPATENCGAYPCTTSGCAKACSSQAECTGNNYCKITSGTTGTCTAKNPNGTAATNTFECSSNVVANGVCCNLTCGGCKACSGAPLTGGAVGQCSNVLAGTTTCDDGNACTTSDMCTNGTCGGAPKCPAASPCKYASTCNAGNCSTQMNWADGQQDPLCAASPGKPYCSGGACVACAVDGNCTAPTPSCSPTTHTCVCRLPSAANKLLNPGFDGGFTSWTNSSTVVAADIESCPGSNSVFVENAENDPYQCFALSAGNYTMGGMFKGPPTGSFLRIRYFPGANCTGTNSTTDDLPLPTTTSWSLFWNNYTAPAGTVSARLGVYGIQLYADQLFVSNSAAF